MIDEKINQQYLKKIKLFQKYNKHEVFQLLKQFLHYLEDKESE